MLDTEGVDILPLVETAAARYGIPIIGLLAMLKAESGLRRTAERWGVWPDVSFGYCQMTVATAARYGIGDRSDTTANMERVRLALENRKTAIDVGAHHLSGCYGMADADQDTDYFDLGHDLAALIIYNAGHLPSPTDPWWQKWAGNVANYKAALAWAAEALA